MIRTVIFDLGNTLIPFSLRTLEANLRECREPAMELARLSEIGAIAPDQLCRRLSELAQIPVCDFEAWWNSIFELRWLILPEDLRRWSARYRLGLISNTNFSHFSFLRARLPLLDQLDFRVLSYELGAVKPAAKIFLEAERLAQCAPAEILYLDDIGEFVEAACGRGWQGVHFTPAGLAEIYRRLD